MMDRISLPRWSHFVVAIVLGSMVLWVRHSAASILGDQGPFFLSALAVLISAYIGGLWPGLLATAVCTTGGIVLFINPSANLGLDSLKTKIIIAAQITVSLCISLVCGALRASEMEAEQAAREKEIALDRLNNLFQSITDPLVILSNDLKTVLVNEAAIELWQIPRGFTEIQFRDLVPAEVFDALAIPLEHSIKKKEPVSVEVTVSSLARTFEVRVFQGVDGLMVYFHDITDRLVTSETLSNLAIQQERVNALLDSLLTHAPIGYAFFDREHRLERVNADFAGISGKSQASHVGIDLRDISPEYAAIAEKAIDRVFDTGEAVENIDFNLEVSGSRRFWLTSFYPVMSSMNEVAAVGAVLFEVTHQKESELRLRESEERFRSVADGAPMMISVCDFEGRPTWFNKLWLEFRGISLEEALQEGCFPKVHAEDSVWVTEKFEQAVNEKSSFSIEYRTYDSQGHLHWLLLQGNPTVDSSGQVQNFLMSSVDVTERKEAEESMRKSLASERTARSDAENANRLKDEFLASLSHELRTPLTTILGWTELLRNPEIRAKELDDGLDVIHRRSKLQIQLINDLLDMSRINAGKISLDLQFADLYEVVESTVQLLKTSAEDKRIDIDVSPIGDPVLVHIDPDKITQIIWNLLTNSIKFTPDQGRVSISIDSDGEMASVKVVDTGVGIEDSFLPFIFDRFRQADGTKTRKHGGLGLGLAISKQLAELHHGTLTASSEGPGTGTTFTLTLPLAKLQIPSELDANSIDSVATDSERLKEIRVLVVEDDEPTRTLVTKWLRLEGAEVSQASSATEARQRLADHSFEVLLSDIGMPTEDGYQLMRSIRGTGENPNRSIPAIAVTAFASDEDKARAFEAGFQYFITKPIKPEVLVESIIEAVQSGLN